MPGHDHDGHRDRMRERYVRGGFVGFAPHEVLELLLFYAIPRRNVNPLAHRLLGHFGSLSAVLEATPDQLQKVPGIGLSTATLLSMVAKVARYAELEQQGERPRLSNFRQAKDYCRMLFAGQTDEILFVICLDAQGRVLRAVDAIHGTIDEIPIYPRTVMECALRHSAHSIVLAHNHPSGVREPSDADLRTTETLRAALAAVDIKLNDHMIYADGACMSIEEWKRDREQGIISAYASDAPKRAADKKSARCGNRAMQEKDD